MPDKLMLNDYFYIQLRQSVRLALPVENVTEVMTVSRSDICPIPGVASALLGVVNQRGQLLWVVELADLLSDVLCLAPSPLQYRSREQLMLAVLAGKPTPATTAGAPPRLACVVSSLKGVVPLNPAELKPIPASFSPAFSSFLSGMTEIEQLSVAVLNVSAVFAAIRIVEK
ncbi:chemotaxis protein CheW [Kamptonema formosum]|uniref:chemotaxis protein CheW n=1 Tax=Kamptonema formosum TaxID=331992 RepID=UPI0012DC7B40|nr:chemotaxis protein CheW [Oscillatoria sp. PCC 10802]